LKEKQPISLPEPIGDSGKHSEGIPEPDETVHEAHDFSNRPPADEGSPVLEISSGPPSEVQSVRTVTPELSQGKEHADDVSDDEVSHNTRRELSTMESSLLSYFRSIIFSQVHLVDVCRPF
jgi:hypothetical protein